jgi:aminoglycoside phosphotransferase (APT) family kinase protein
MDTRPILRDPQSTVEQDWGRLAAYLAKQGWALGEVPPPRQFAGGLANLNYLLLLNGEEAVLRRPPLGPLPVGAFNMEREFNVLHHMNAGFALAPKALHFCSSPEVLGAPFQLLEYRRGFSVRSTLPAELVATRQIEERLVDILLDVMIRLHTLVGLNKLGKPEGFLQRAVNGWTKRAYASIGGPRQSNSELIISAISSWLQTNRIPEGRASLIHNDLKLDNIVLESDNLVPIAVLDWDQCTRGDSLFDLATTLSYYAEAGDHPVMHEIKQMPTGTPGFPSRREVAERYAKRVGADLSNLKFYRVLASFKLGVIFEQLHQRFRNGTTSDLRYASFGPLAHGIFEFTHAISKDEIF